MGAIGSIGANAGSNIAYTWAGKPAAAGNSGATIRVTDVGGAGGSLWTSNGTDWFPVGGVVVLAVSGANVANTGNTTENTVATVTIPAGMLGANGAVEVIPLWDFTNNANTKTMRVKFGASLTYSIVTATVSCQMQYFVRNANSVSAQVAQASSGSSGMGAVASSLLTGTINTSNAVDITMTAQCNTSGTDTINLRGYIVRLMKT